MLRHFLSKQFLGFLGVGVTAAGLHWLARILLSNWFTFSIAVVLAYAVGMAVAFSLNAAFVFPNSSKPRSAQARSFVLVNLAFFPVVWASSEIFLKILNSLGWMFYPEAIAHGFALVVPMVATFLIYKFSTFKE